MDGRRCVREALIRLQDEPTSVMHVGASRPLVVVAIGKAASSMTLGAHDACAARIRRSIVVTKPDHASAELRALRSLHLLEASHPIPDERSLAAGAAVLEAVNALESDELPVFLVSGGSSSLVEVLRAGVSLADLADYNRRALAGGQPIDRVNAGRAELSLLKGGGLTRALGQREGVALFISDVPRDDPAVIGSGVLGPAAGDRVHRRVVATLADALAGAARRAIDRGEPVAARSGTATDSGDAARDACHVHVDAQRFDADVRELALRFVRELDARPPGIGVWGGESTVRLPASPGRGGRNQHLALAMAAAIRGRSDVVLLAAGTDGTDGPTLDAGGLVDGDTWQRVLDAGVDPERCLDAADAGSALEAAGDLVHTGPTGTNVCDLVIGMRLHTGVIY